MWRGGGRRWRLLFILLAYLGLISGLPLPLPSPSRGEGPSWGGCSHFGASRRKAGSGRRLFLCKQMRAKKRW